MADEDKENGEGESREERLLRMDRKARKKLIMGVAAGALFGGAASFFAMYFVFNPKEETVVEEVVEQEPEEVIIYQELRIKRLPAALTNDRGESIGYYFLDILLSMTTLEDHKLVAARLPFVQEVINKDISYNGISLEGRPGTVDYDKLPERLRTAINKYFGSERVKMVTLEKVAPGQ